MEQLAKKPAKLEYEITYKDNDCRVYNLKTETITEGGKGIRILSC